MKAYVCTQCGHHGPAKSITPGSTGTELFLWLLFLVPGLLYSLWRLSARYQGCTACGSKAIIPPSTPKGMAIIEEMKRARSTEPLRQVASR